MRDIPFHPVANLFPLMSDDERRELREDIRQNGLREAIWLHEGQIIDGRNRYQCCRDLGLSPETREWQGEGSLVSLVVGLNLHRRHLTASQRAAVAAEALPMFEAEAEERRREKISIARRRSSEMVAILPPSQELPEPKSRDQVGATFNVAPRYVQDAKTVRETAPDLFEQVKSGETTIQEATRQVRKEQERERLAAAPIPELPPSAIVERNDTTEHLSDGYADLILTDPPYNISDSAKLTKVGDSIETAVFAEEWDITDPGEYRASLYDWATEWERLLRPGGAVISFIDRRMVSFLWDAFLEADLTPKAILTWVKRNVSPTGLVRRNLLSATEFMVWAVKPGASYTFNEVPDWDRRNVIETNIITAQEKVDHPTQKPLNVLSPLIAFASHPGNLILDPYAGSGSVGVAALNAGRRCHLIERNPEYVVLAQHRLSREGYNVRSNG